MPAQELGATGGHTVGSQDSDLAACLLDPTLIQQPYLPLFSSGLPFTPHPLFGHFTHPNPFPTHSLVCSLCPPSKMPFPPALSYLTSSGRSLMSPLYA